MEHTDVIAGRAQKVYDLVINYPDKNRNLTKHKKALRTCDVRL